MAKRANREGLIRKRRDGLWEARVMLDGKCVSLYAKTQKLALDKLDAAKTAHKEGLPPVPAQDTVEQFLVEWLESTVKPSTRASTYASYRGVVNTHLIPAIGSIQLAKLSPQDVQGLLTRLLNTNCIVRASTKKGAATPEPRKLSARTAEYCILVLRRALNKAVAWRMVPRNVASVVRTPRVAKEEVRFLTPEQARQLLKVVKGHNFEALYSVALAIGLRRGEALGLRWSDVDLDNGTLIVRNQLQRIGGRLGLTEPKTSSARRALALPDFAVKALKAHRARQAKTRLGAGENWKETGYVFTTCVGTPVEPGNITRHFAKALETAKLPPMRFHDLRHTCASLLLAQGQQPRVVMEILGHSRISLTMDTYSHVMPSVKREAANVMDGVLRARKGTGRVRQQVGA